MAKPKTSYTPVTKNKTTFAPVAKNAGSFATISKNKNSFSPLPKSPTSFNRNNSISSWLLNSTVVTLNSTLYRLNGFTTATAPNQSTNKNATTYTAV